MGTNDAPGEFLTILALPDAADLEEVYEAARQVLIPNPSRTAPASRSAVKSLRGAAE